MALTLTKMGVYRGQGQADEVSIKAVTGAADYVTGGYVITPSMFGFNAYETDGQGTGLPPVADYYSIDGDGVGTPYAVINPANGNLQLFVTTTGVEVANGATPAWTGFLRSYGH